MMRTRVEERIEDIRKFYEALSKGRLSVARDMFFKIVNGMMRDYIDLIGGR